MNRSRFFPLSIVHCALFISILACGGPEPDRAATLDAAVAQTVAAQQTAGATPRPTVTPAPPAATAQPPISITLQYPTDTLAPTLIPTQPPAPSATPTSLTSSPLVHARRVTAPPAIDGNIIEWLPLNDVIDQVTYRAENWTGPADNSAAYAVGWDAVHLYIAAQVTDDVHAQIALGELMFKGDGLELLLDVNLSGDYADDSLSNDDYQIGFTPGENKVGGPDAYLWFPREFKGKPANVGVSAVQDETGHGFYLEAAIPWVIFGVTPQAGATFGFVLSVSDNDTPGTQEQQSLISSVKTRILTDPTTWGTLILEP